MNRNDLLRKLQRYKLRWPDEAVSVSQFMHFVESNPDCFKRELRCGHVTASAWLVNRAGSGVLLTHHKKLRRWLQCGGHADGNPDVARVALLEVWEESGLKDVVMPTDEIFDLDIHLIPARPTEPEHLHYDLRFVVQAVGSERYIVSDESHDLRWVAVEDLREITQEESILRMARKWQKEGVRWAIVSP